MEDCSEVAAYVKKDNEANPKKKQRRGLFSRVWKGMFKLHSDDIGKRLKHISKEEAAALSRIRRRYRTWRRIARYIIVFSVIFEAIAVGYAIMTTRSMELNWQIRAFHVLPMFLLPIFSSLMYTSIAKFIHICDQKDQKTVERLRTERQEKVDELKEKSNYYSTQQLIQRYDTDPAAKAAAAAVLASKLAIESGLKVSLGDEMDDSINNNMLGKSNSVELVQTSGLRNRKSIPNRSFSADCTLLLQNNINNPEEGHDYGHGHDQDHDHYHDQDQELLENNFHHHYLGGDDKESGSYSPPNHIVGENSVKSVYDAGWIARIAALIVGEDPRQSYALICTNCHMHNGLTRKEDFPYVTYYCPHCNALNRSKHLDGFSSVDSPNMSSSSFAVSPRHNDSLAELQPVSSGEEQPPSADHEPPDSTPAAAASSGETITLPESDDTQPNG
ncbi:uncharacterized protein At2g24330-like [Impatiens glandulifera]|uniref:uncharacterized protein At2g24330-like n=1 Tax=Impatiens glandulifera TaxID=253017 RepID=UPI001FB10690|nr:uncharacterized protein At2g24330-like [Impatiens glandulifera]